MYLQACLKRRRDFTPIAYSEDGIPGAEALAAQKRLAALLSYKLKQEYSEMCCFVWVWMSLAIVRSNSLHLRGPRDKGARIAAPRVDGWVGDGSARALAWLNIGNTEGTDESRISQGLISVRKGCCRIARDRSELDYSW